MVSAKAKDVEAAKAFVKWLWIDNSAAQEDFNLSYGFHIPPRKSLAAKAEKLQPGPPPTRLKIFNESAVAANPSWTPKMGNAYADAATAIVRKGGDIDAQPGQGGEGRRRRAPAPVRLRWRVGRHPLAARPRRRPRRGPAAARARPG